jgi:hypothetical protein
MVYAHEVNRVTFSGHMFGGVEEWSTGFWLGEEGADAATPTQAMADALKTLWQTMFVHANSRINANYTFTQCKVTPLFATGGTDGANVKYSYPTGSVVGGVATETLPPQCSVVLSLLSDRPRGLASKGRMYLPGISSSPGTSGKLSSTVAGNIATQCETFFNGVRAHADIPNTPILVAKGTGLFPELTAQNDYIQTIRVGDVIDTQRRRRNGLAEIYINKTLV